MTPYEQALGESGKEKLFKQEETSWKTRLREGQ